MKTKKVIITISVILFFGLFCLSLLCAGTVIVKPCRFDHFTLQVPEKTIAGESFVIRAQVYDSYNNLITNFSESGEEFEVTVTGSANVQPSHLGPASFPGGVTNIIVTDKKAEAIVFSIYKAGGTVPVISKEITIPPNKLNHFIVQAPTNVTAGKSFDVVIIAKDLFDNTVSDAEMANKYLKITSAGASPLKIVGKTRLNFKSGAASATLVSEKIGSAVVDVQEVSTGSSGRGEVIVNPAELGYFRIYSPKEAVAGEPFEITVSAYDIYGNPINNYLSIGNGVRLETTGKANLEPSFIKPLEFKNNEATIEMIYKKSEQIYIIAKEHDKNQSGKSNLIRISLPIADHFVVSTPDVAVSGQPFKIKIEAYDRFNNLVKNYKLTGIDVILRTTGTGVLSPSVISSSEFVDGVALVDVFYNKAESFDISATMASVKTTERITPAPKPPPVTKKIEKKKAKKEVMKHPFSISNVSIIEAKEKAMLVINLTSPDGQIEYKGEIESRHGKKWLKIRLKPAVRKTEKSLKFKSEFIGEVLVEEDKTEQDALNVYVELIPSEITYDIARIKNSLITTVAKP